MRAMAFIGACIASALFALPAFADIRSFNAAVVARDFQKAAAEAASTWPTLDKSREDIALIAREFGFAAYVAGDFAAAKTYAEFAAAKPAEGAASEFHLLSNVLLRAAEHRLKPSEATRNALLSALEARAALPGFDNITFVGIEAVVGHDFEKGRWKDATASTELAAKLATAGGSSFLYERRKYELYRNVADYRVTEKAEVYYRLGELLEAICAEAIAIPDDKAAQRLADLYWEVSAWRGTLSAHLRSRGVREFTRREKEREAEEKARWERLGEDERLIRLLGRAPNTEDERCGKTFDQKRKPEFPMSAFYRGFVGSVVLRADIDEAGMLHNPEILAAVPEKFFGGAVLEAIGEMRYLPGKDWDPAACTMAQENRIVTFEFVLPR